MSKGQVETTAGSSTMSVGESLRYRAFMAADKIRGGLIHKHIRDLETAFGDAARGRQHAQQRLDQILKHAVETTGFYQQFEGYAGVQDFPVIQKDTIRENYNGFLSNAYAREALFKAATSGSYGTPFTFWLSPEKRARQLAEVVFFGGWANYRVGMKYAQFRVRHKGKLHLFKQNAVLINPRVIDETWLAEKRAILREEKVEFIAAYPTGLLPLAEYCRDKGDGPDDFHLKGIVSGAEPLLDSARSTFEELFGCVVLDRYSSNELGVIAHECSSQRNHHINYGGHNIELLKLESEEPVDPGQVGRVVVTDYFSHAMPLIRYDTGDTSKWAEEECPCGLEVPILDGIGGRVVEAISDPAGKLINALAIGRDPKDLEGIVQYQFIQKGRDTYLMKLHVTDQFTDEALLRRRLMKLLGPDARLSFDYVDSIPPLPSGKRPYVVNEYTHRTR